jgi:hypothetical protein|tara:strand:- start:1284 stop:1475 length:192 start_codon:yes stop_codon:yes gene_type:complete
MRIGDLVRYKEVLNYRTMEKTEWKLGVLVDKRHNLCDVLSREGRKLTLWASLVQKAGKKDAYR